MSLSLTIRAFSENMTGAGFEKLRLLIDFAPASIS
jgi:hypothetical protein